MGHLRISLYAFMLAAAGIPLYIHLPRFASVNLGIGLGAIGTLLLAIRLIDLVQDPLIGWAIDRWPKAQALFAALSALGLAIGFPLLFSLGSGPSAFVSLLLVLILLFSAYSLGMILLYGRTETLAAASDAGSLMTVATFRECGMLAGVIVAAIAPGLFLALGAGGQGYPAFGIFLGGIAVVTWLMTRPIWQRAAITGAPFSLTDLKSAGALKLLFLALINSLPVAITSTLFLFFVQDRLTLPSSAAGPLLILFFLSAGISVPLWSKVSRRNGPKKTLIIAMPLAIVSFIGAALIAPGNWLAFAAVCIGSGAALGADMVLLPAMFTVALTRAKLKASQAYGLWSFAGKLGLALAAFLVLPALENSGFEPGAVNDAQALSALNISYAIVPCILKLCAFGLVLALPTEEQKP